MRRIALKIAYEGTAYAGWQRQENGPSIQQSIEDTVERLFHEKVSLMGSGRTDAGVHARGQVAAMDLNHPIPADKLLLALNSNLPEDIRIYQVWEAEADFHPRFEKVRLACTGGTAAFSHGGGSAASCGHPRLRCFPLHRRHESFHRKDRGKGGGIR